MSVENTGSDRSNELQLLDAKEAAGLLGVSVRTIRRMFASKELPVVRFRHCTRVRESDVTEYIDKSRRAGQL
jgi:excisionase family DNA binding protein